MNIKDIRLLILGTSEYGKKISRQLHTRDVNALYLPLIQHNKRVLAAEDVELIANAERYSAIIFVSTNAVRYGVDYMLQYLGYMPNTRYFAPGITTKKLLDKTLSHYHMHAQIPTLGQTSEDLLHAQFFQQLTHKDKILIIRADNGRDYIKQVLQDKGISVHYLRVYNKDVIDAPMTEIIYRNQINTFFLSSGLSLQYLCNNIGVEMKIMHNFAVFVPSKRLYDVAIQYFNQVYNTQCANIDCLFCALQKSINFREI